MNWATKWNIINTKYRKTKCFKNVRTSFVLCMCVYVLQIMTMLNFLHRSSSFNLHLLFIAWSSSHTLLMIQFVYLQFHNFRKISIASKRHIALLSSLFSVVSVSHYSWSSSPKRRCHCCLGVILGLLFMLCTLIVMCVCVCAQNCFIYNNINNSEQARKNRRMKQKRERERKKNSNNKLRTICAHNSFISSGFFPFNLLFCFLSQQLNISCARIPFSTVHTHIYKRTLTFSQ